MFVCPECGESRDQAGPCPRDGANLAEPTPGGLHGYTIGSYRVARVLGVGGMGEVYLAVHPDIGSRVAIKVLAKECVKSPELVERFFTEARTVNRIRHENIINVLDMGALEDRRPYIIMEFLEGQPMSSVLARHGVWPLGTLARLSGEILDALGAAHRTGVVHRDLKPDNIFVTPNSHAKVLDFGIAKLLPEYGGGGSTTRTGMLLGTPTYMAPEQVTGGAVTGATDIYALGVILYEAATGTQPIRGETLLDLLTKIANEVPVAPRSLRPDIPAAYEAVILRAMAKQPQERYASTVEMAMALKEAAAELPPPAWASISTAGGNPHVTIGPQSTGRGSNPAVQELVSAKTAPGQVPGPPSVPIAAPPVQKPRSNALAISVVLAGAIIGAATLFALTRGSGDSGEDSKAVATATGQRAGSTTDAGLAAMGQSGEQPTPANTAGHSATNPTTNPPGKRGSSKRAGTHKAPANTTSKPTTRSGIFDPKTSKVTKTASGTTIVIGGPPAKNRIKLQANYNVKRFDARAYLPRARSLAKTIFSDAELVQFDVGGVRPDGLADLTLGSGQEATYWYRSPSRSKRPKNAPVGVEVEIKCMVYVIASAKGVSAYPRTFEKCNHPFRPKPRCSLKQVWQKALKLKAPKNGVAQIDYLWDGWFFQIKGTSFTESITDSC